MVCIVSTHFDDAVLSAATPLLRDGSKVTVVTVRAGTPAADVPASHWDLACGFASAADAAMTRQAEDRAACALTNARPVHLELLDRPYIHGDDTASILSAVAPQIANGCELWLPVGIGGHPDHLATRTALMATAQAHDGAVMLYADTPYACVEGWDAADDERDPAYRFAPHLAAWGVTGDPAVTTLDAPTVSAKLELVRCHASQLAGLSAWVPRFMHLRGPLQTELSWRLR